MPEIQTDDLTKPLIEPNPKYGKFVPDPNDSFIQRYIPDEIERERIESYLKDEIDRASRDDAPNRSKKLRLLDAYHAKALDKQIVTLPILKRAVNQNVAWVTDTIMSHKPLVTVTPDSNTTTTVLVEDKTLGPVPVEKTSEEVAAALEMWLEYKLRKQMRFRRIVATAAMEAKRGQTPTWLKVIHKAEKRVGRSPRYEQKGPVAVTFAKKDDLEFQYGEATRIENVSTFSMLMPVDQQDPQTSPWLAEYTPQSPEDFRASLYNGDYFLIDKSEYEALIADGADDEQTEVDQKKANTEQRVASAPRKVHKIWFGWYFWTVPMKQTLASVADDGTITEKTVTINQEYSMAGYFHEKLGRLLSTIRNPFDHGMRPYVPVFDRKEPFRHTGGSLAEDVAPVQKLYNDCASLEVKGGILATTPIFYVEPGSIAGDWLIGNTVEPGDNIPRQRPDEIEAATLGERPQSLLGLMGAIYEQFQQDTSLGDLQLGLNLPSRTPASSLAQVLNQGETQAAMFLEDFRLDLADIIKLYVQTVQQYMRFGEVIPFDPDTAATVKAALMGDDQGEAPTAVPVRFPQAPLHHQFAFDIAASGDDRSKQNDFERLIALKQQIDSDGAIVAQMIGPLAGGQLPPSIENILIEDFKRREFAMNLIAKSMRKDGERFAINPKLMQAMLVEQQQMKAAQAQAAQNGAQGGPQGTGGGPVGNGAGGGGDQSGLGGAVPQQGVPQMPFGDQAGAPSSDGQPPMQ